MTKPHPPDTSQDGAVEPYLLLTTLTGAAVDHTRCPVDAPQSSDKSCMMGQRKRATLLAIGKPLARAILRNARLKRWTMLFLARFPRLYAVAYRTMLQPDAAAAAPATMAALSPRAGEAYRRLRTYVPQEPPCASS